MLSVPKNNILQRYFQKLWETQCMKNGTSVIKLFWRLYKEIKINNICDNIKNRCTTIRQCLLMNIGIYVSNNLFYFWI